MTNCVRCNKVVASVASQPILRVSDGHYDNYFCYQCGKNMFSFLKEICPNVKFHVNTGKSIKPTRVDHILVGDKVPNLVLGTNDVVTEIANGVTDTYGRKCLKFKIKDYDCWSHSYRIDQVLNVFED